MIGVVGKYQVYNNLNIMTVIFNFKALIIIFDSWYPDWLSSDCGGRSWI